MLLFKSLIEGKLSDSYEREWEGSIIEKVEVFRHQRRWRINLLIPQPVPALVINDTAAYLQNHYEYLNSLEINLHLLNCAFNLEKMVKDRKKEVISLLFGKTDGCSDEELTWQFEENRIDLLCGNQKLYQKIIDQEGCERLSAWIWQEYYLQVLVRTILDKAASPRQKVVNLVSGQKPEIIYGQDPGQKARRGSARYSRKKLEHSITDSPIAIRDVQEGLKSAVVEGEVWEKEISPLKDGRLVVSYYLSDFADSIVAKLFLDKSDEDKIQIGDRVRVKGAVRYDGFLKESVLYPEAYSKQPGKTRQDKASSSRVELHCHTKMSAMDGIAGVEDIIKRAVEWQWPALAITDHGCVQAFPEAYTVAQREGIKVIYGVEAYLIEEDKKERPFHIILLVKNKTGLKNLYKLVSKSYLEYFYRFPKIPRQELLKYREGLLLGTACEAGELFRALLRNADEQELGSIISFYDYLEIQPPANNMFLIREEQLESEQELMDLTRKIINLGNKYNKPVVATGDVHFLDPQDQCFRTIIQAGQGYENAESQAPLFLKTTEEMLADFAFLGEKEARKVVVDNSLFISNQIENIKPVPDGFYPPEIEGAEESITELTWQNARALYGENLPKLVEERINRELEAINQRGYAVLYLIAHQLVKKSNQDGYLVGSRGSVGSSLVAFFTGITEVNALKPHYLCPYCHYSEFFEDGKVGCGVDLPDRECPVCGRELRKDGFDIPFETFLGFKGEKIPDIDLNFSGDYQGRAHQFVEELFGHENVYRAGTISTIAEKTAFGFVKKYSEENNLNLKNSEIARLARGITGVRRTTGQHPGGLIVVPRQQDIFNFTPLQHPADNKQSGVVTTHFEYHAIGEQLVKLDILGHDDPTVIKELEDLTGVSASSISLSEKETMCLFSGVEPLGVKPEDISSPVGTYGIPEFGTRFVRQMLEATRPNCFSELVRISGLSHGTDVWVKNAQDLIERKVASLREVICTRDDIMGYLINTGIEENLAFKIMERIRKGKGLGLEELGEMRRCQIPEWYMNSCQRIKYLFPKAHAVAYVAMAFRIAWYKVYYPLQFYASFFGIRAEDFEATTVLAGYDAISKRIAEIEKLGLKAPQKDKKLLTVLEVALEMYARGYCFYPVDIYQSDAVKFIIRGQGLVLPFSALPNIGNSAAQGLVQARDKGSFVSVEDFQLRTNLNKTAMEILRKENCFKGLPEKTQISLFA